MLMQHIHWGLRGLWLDKEIYEEALSDVKSAISFHIETFGDEVLETDSPVLEALFGV